MKQKRLSMLMEKEEVINVDEKEEVINADEEVNLIMLMKKKRLF